MVLHNKDWQQISFYSCAAKFQTFVPTHSSFSSAVCAQKPTRHQPWSDGRFLTLTQRRERWHTNMFKHTLFHTLIAARLVVSHVHYKAHTPLSPRTRDRHMSPDLNSQPLHVLLTRYVIWFESGAFVGFLWEGPWSWCLSRCWRSLVLLLGRHCWNKPVSLKVKARQRCSLFILCFIRVLKHQHVLNVIWWESMSSACLKF